MNLSDLTRNSCMLGNFSAKRGYMRWWHSFSGRNVQTGTARTFFVEIFMINPALGGARPILGQHPHFKKRGMKPSYVMVKAGVFPDENGNEGRQLHAFYPISSLRTTDSPLVMQAGNVSSENDNSPEDDISCGNFLYSEDRLTGFVHVSPEKARRRSLMTEAGYMKWDLTVSKSVSCHTGILAGRLFRALHLLNSFWHGEGIRSFFQGSVILDGDVYEIIPDLSYGCADKHWGRSFNKPWFQFTCSKMTSGRTGKELRHSVLAVNSFCPRFLCFSFRHKFMLQLTYMGEDFQFTHCRLDTKETGRRFVWHMSARNKTAVLKLSGSCKKAEMLHLQYENPDGVKSKLPLWAGSDGVGAIQLYRRVSGARELVDSLKLENALCIYQSEP